MHTWNPRHCSDRRGPMLERIFMTACNMWHAFSKANKTLINIHTYFHAVMRNASSLTTATTSYHGTHATTFAILPIPKGHPAPAPTPETPGPSPHHHKPQTMAPGCTTGYHHCQFVRCRTTILTGSPHCPIPNTWYWSLASHIKMIMPSCLPMLA